MANILQMPSGARADDPAHPTTAAAVGVNFSNSGVLERCGWTVYVPASVLHANPLFMRFYYADFVGIAGNAICTLRWGRITSTGTVTENIDVDTIQIPFTGVAFTVQYVDVDLVSKMTTNTTHLFMSMERNSSLATDTFAGTLALIGGASTQG